MLLKFNLTFRIAHFADRQTGRLLRLSLLTALLFSHSASAQPLYDNRALCLSDPATCYQQSTEGTARYSVGAREWYRIKMMQLLALIEMQRFTALKRELEDVIVLRNPPIVFKATVYTYYAKVLLLEGNEAEGRQYLQQALTLVSDINHVLPDPFRSAEILNLYSYVPELNSDAVAFAETLIPNVTRVSDPIGLAELYTSLGHTFKYASQLKKSLHYYEQALRTYEDVADTTRKASAFHNVASGHKNLGDYQRAERFLKRSIAAWGTNNAVLISKNHAQLVLVETYILRGKTSEAKALLGKSHIDDMPHYQRALFDRLNQILDSSQH